MRVTTAHAGGLLLLGIWLTAGCQTVAREDPSAPAWDPEVDVLDADHALFADVLARYASGLIHDMSREYDLALADYLEAVKLDPQNEELHFRIAMGLLHENRAEEAIRMMEDLVDRRPTSPNALMWLALLYRSADRPALAIESYHRLIDLDPSEAEPYLDLASYHLRLNQQDEAIAVLSAGAKTADKPLELCVALGQVHDRSAADAEGEAKHHHLAEAIAAYQKASKLAPDSAELLLKLGGLHIQANEMEEAVEMYEKVERLHPEDLKVRRQLALSFVQIGDVDRAISSLETLSRDKPSNAQLYYYIGELYQEKGDLDQAIHAFTQATTAARKDPTPYIRLALIQMEHDPAGAIGTLHRGLDQMRDHPRLTEILAYAHLDNEEYSTALDWMTRAEVLLGDDADGRFYFSYARAAYFAGHQDTVVRCLSKALEESPLYPQAFMQEILAVDKPDLDEAIQLFQALAERNAEDPAVYLFLGLLKSYNEQFEEAVSDFQRVERLVREDHAYDQLLNEEYYFSYAAALERSGEIETAEDFFLKTIELRPDHSNAHNYLAYMWAERGIRLEEALDHVNTALSITPDSGAFLDTLGWIYFQQGKYEEALTEIQRADALTPDDPTISDHLGDALQKLGRLDEAITFWKKSLALDPDNERVTEKLKAEAMEPAPASAEDAPAADLTGGTETAPVSDAQVPIPADVEPVGVEISVVEDAQDGPRDEETPSDTPPIPAEP